MKRETCSTRVDYQPSIFNNRFARESLTRPGLLDSVNFGPAHADHSSAKPAYRAQTSSPHPNYAFSHKTKEGGISEPTFELPAPEDYPSGSYASRGDLVWGPVAFSDGKRYKQRPILVLRGQGDDLVAVPLTKHSPRSEFDIAIMEWAASGLKKPSTVQCGKVFQLARTAVRKAIGVLNARDFSRVNNALARWSRTITGEPPGEMKA